MLDPKRLRKDTDFVIDNLKRRGYVFDIDTWTKLETKRKDLQSKNETQQSELNDISKEIGLAKKDGKDISSLQDKASNLTQEIKEQTKILDELLRDIEDFTLSIPNLIDIDVPDGKDEKDNIEIIKSDIENNLLYLKGSIPGSKNTEVMVKKAAKNIKKLTMLEKIEAYEKAKKVPDKKKK